MSATEDKIKTSIFEIPHGVHEYTQFSFSDEEAKETFLKHDHLARLKNQDNAPIICGKFFEKYYLFGQALVLNDKTLRIVSVTKIPNEFIKSLSDKSFYTIIGSFYEKVAENFTFKTDIIDQDTTKKVAEIFLYSFIDNKKYYDFLKKYQVS